LPGQGAGISFLTYVADHYDRLLELSLEHLAVVLVALLVGADRVGAGVAVYRRPRLRAWAG
jgi:ABC-type proline/glycine betaine transport system permease subunit